MNSTTIDTASPVSTMGLRRGATAYTNPELGD